MHRVVHRPRQLARLRLHARHAAHDSELERLALVPVELSSRQHQREEHSAERHRSRREARLQVERREVLHQVVLVLTPVLRARRARGRLAAAHLPGRSLARVLGDSGGSRRSLCEL